MALWLQQLGAEVCGYALQPPTEPSLFQLANVTQGMKSVIGDLADREHLETAIREHKPEIVIHMAAQALVRHSYAEPVATFQTNVMGTINVFEAALKSPEVRAVLNVTTDKCYENKEWEWGYRENEPMGGHDPYSASKACSEIVTASYRKSFFEKKGIALGSARAGNVFGGGDWAMDRLIPDVMRSLTSNQPLVIRNPTAQRPWQHVLEPLSGYLRLSQLLFEQPDSFSEAFNFGPSDSDTETVETLVRFLLEAWNPKLGVRIEGSNLHEAHYLKLDCSKAKTRLQWTPKLNLHEGLRLLLDWNRATVVDKISAREVTLRQINEYQARQ